MTGDDESRRGDDRDHPGGPDAGATEVHRPPSPGDEAGASADTVARTPTPPGAENGTQRHDVPPAPSPWRPGPGPGGTPVAPWEPGTGGFPHVPPAGPTFGTPPVVGGAGPWGPPPPIPPAARPGPPGAPPPGIFGAPPGAGGPGGYLGPFGPPPGSGAPHPRRRVWIVGIAAVVVALLVVTTVLLVVTRRASPAATLEAGVADLRGWEGATYSGRIPDAAGGQANLEITVDRTGTAAGTVTRDGGGRAEFVLAGREQAIRGDRAWWQHAADRPELVDRLSDQWLSDAFTELPRGLSSWGLSPDSLADRLSSTRVGEEDGVVVGGRNARVLTPGNDGRSVTVLDAEPPTLAAFQLPGFGTGRLSAVSVHRAEPAALQNVRDLARRAPTMKSYIVALVERPRLTVSVEGGRSTCRTPTCTITVRLVNTGNLATSGTIVVTLNGAEVARHPFTSVPGSNLTFPTSAANPVYDRPGAQITALWRARVEGGR